MIKSYFAHKDWWDRILWYYIENKTTWEREYGLFNDTKGKIVGFEYKKNKSIVQKHFRPLESM